LEAQAAQVDGGGERGGTGSAALRAGRGSNGVLLRARGAPERAEVCEGLPARIRHPFVCLYLTSSVDPG